MTMTMSDEEFIHIETTSTLEIQKNCHICTHECASESLFELHMKEHEEKI